MRESELSDSLDFEPAYDPRDGTSEIENEHKKQAPNPPLKLNIERSRPADSAAGKPPF